MVKGVISKLAACVMMVCFFAVSSAFAGQASITAPADGARLAAPAVFTIDPNGQDYGWMYVGSSLGGYQYFSQYVDNQTSVTIPGLPSDNSTVYIRYWSNNGGSYTYNDYSFIANGTSSYDASVMTTPAANGATLAKEFTFEWSATAGATSYWVWIGSTLGGAQYLSTGVYSGTSLKADNLPTTGATVYVRLYTRCGNFQSYRDYNYNSTFISSITSPANGAVLAKPAAFTWQDTGADQYWLYIGSTVGGYQYYTSNQATALSAPVVPGLPQNGSNVYVRLWSREGAEWGYTDSSYIASTSASTDLAQITIPGAGDNITDNNSATFAWDNGTNLGSTRMYWLAIGTTGAGSVDIYNKNMVQKNRITQVALPNNSDIYVRLFTTVGTTLNFQKYIDYVFKTRAQ